MRRRVAVIAVVLATFALAASVGGCTSGSSGARSSASPISSRPTVASPTPFNLTLPTTIGDVTLGAAELTKPTSRARASASEALARNDLRRSTSQWHLSATVLADVTMPNDYIEGKQVRNLPCWVFVFTLRKPYDPAMYAVTLLGATPHPTPSPRLAPRRLDWHIVSVIDASNGQFVRDFSVR